MSIAKRFLDSGRTGPILVNDDWPMTGRGVVMPMLLIGNSWQVQVGMRVRDRLLKRIRKMSDWPTWAQTVFRVADARWWLKLGKGYVVSPEGLRRRSGEEINLSLLPE